MINFYACGMKINQITQLGVIIRIFFNTFPVLLIINSTIRKQRTPPNKVSWLLLHFFIRNFRVVRFLRKIKKVYIGPFFIQCDWLINSLEHRINYLGRFLAREIKRHFFVFCFCVRGRKFTSCIL